MSQIRKNQPTRLLPGHFQREINYKEQIELTQEYQSHMEKEYKRKFQELQDSLEEHMETNNEDLLDDIEQQSRELEELEKIIKTSQKDLDTLYKLEKETSKNQVNPELFNLRITMMNLNFAETYKDYVCSTSSVNEVDIEFEGKSREYNEDIIALRSCNPHKPLFLKVGKPGHLFAVLIFFDEKICEIWDTGEVSSIVKQFFSSILPTYFTIICINTQIQVAWCETGEENVFIVKRKASRKHLVNIYCQTWPFFFAYMRCVKKASNLDILKFLSCLTVEEKIDLIDTFNTYLANNGEDVQHIKEINNKKNFDKYVRSCNRLLDIGKSISFASSSQYEELELTKQDEEFKKLILDK
jgi:hypothetical protein